MYAEPHLYASVVTEEKLSDELRFRTSPTLKKKWEKVCEARKITQQSAINGLLQWFVEEDELLQAMLLGQLTSSDDLTKLILQRKEANEGVPSPALAGGRKLTPEGQAQFDAVKKRVEERDAQRKIARSRRGPGDGE